MASLTDKQKNLLYRLKNEPFIVGIMLGFTKLTPLHNEWMKDMLYGDEDETLQSHRGSYKTTCVSISLALIVLLYPYEKTLFNRKTDDDVTEIIAQVKKILKSSIFQEFSNILYGQPLILTTERVDEIDTNLAADEPRGTSQLLGMGTKSSITGKHYDRIFTDDIVNVEDRTSKAERERTKIFYQELQNIRNRGGRIFNTGTPWHEDDCFKLMPQAKKYDCYSTGLMTVEEIAFVRDGMIASLFAANYELRHIASDKVIFTNPVKGAERYLAEQGRSHVDAAYGGEDYTAFTICAKRSGKYYVYGRLWHKHVDDCLDDIVREHKSFKAGRIACENNADKGYLAKDLRKKGLLTHEYHEEMNKFLKITTYLKRDWKNIVFVEGTDEEYIRMVTDYTEDAEHDDAPDSLASLIRDMWNKNGIDEARTSRFM